MSKQPLFNFQLFPLEQIQPWGTPPDLELSWYALTLGQYWIKLANVELFRYTDAIWNHWNTLRQYQAATPNALPYDEYQLAHIDSSLNELLYETLEPVPAEVAAHIPQIDSARNARHAPPVPAEVIYQLNNITPTPEQNDFDIATEWWRARQLDALYLRYQPAIHFWRIDNIIHILWQTSHLSENNIPVCTASDGRCQLPADQFIQEYRDFRNRLAKAMRERVDHLLQTWEYTDIKLDLSKLEKNQSDFEASLPHTCTVTAHTDWTLVLDAIHRSFNAN